MIFRNWVMQNFPFLEDDFDALTDYELFCKICGYVIEYSKDNEEMKAKIEEFQHYFDNLDLQEEVNNKLDEMAESGELENLIGQYIQLATTYVYNNVDEMKEATNLVNGSFARTSGFYEFDDNGGAYYKIRTLTNADVVDNIHLFTLDNTDNLVAELIVNDYNIAKFGAKSGEDVTDIIEYVLSIMSNGDKLIIPSGEYTIGNALSIDKIITIEGTSLATSVGSKLIFNSNGLLLKNSNIEIKNISLDGEKDNYNTLDIDNNIFGKCGIICEYTDSYNSGGVKLSGVSINGFNIGIVMYSTMTSNKWSGAYREFKDCDVTYNDIGYLIKDGATYNSIIGGHISSNSKYGLYVDANILYQNLEIIDTALEINGSEAPYTDELTYFGCYINSNSKVKFTNSYLEKMNVFVDNGGTAIFENCHIHSNVQCFGVGQILSIGSHGVFNNEYDFGTDLANNSTNTGLTLANTYGTGVKYITITSSNTGTNRLNLPNILNIPIPLKNIENIKIEFDANVSSGYQNVDFGLKPRLELVGYGSGNSDYLSVENNYAVKNIKPINNEWCHFTYYYKPRISLMSTPENIVYRASLYLFFNNSVDSDASDFSVNNLSMTLANPKLTIYAKSNT